MDTCLHHSLPARKRLGLQHKQSGQQSRNPILFDVAYTLPTKKRSQPRRILPVVPDTTTFPLPTKKRLRDYQLDKKRADQQLRSMDYSICEDDGQQYSLPAKKRRESRNVVCDVDPAADTVPVRNRKRVCAFEPDFVFDLNVEYNEMEKSEVVEEVPRIDGLGLEDKTVDDKISNECVDLDIVSNVETNEIDTISEVAEEVAVNDGFLFEGKLVADRISDGKESVDQEIVGDGGGEVTESKNSEVVGNLGMNDIIEIEENRAEVEKETSNVIEEMGNTDGVTKAEVNISKAKVSAEFVDVKSPDKISGVVDGCGHDGERDACFEGATDGNCDNLISGNGAKSASAEVESSNKKRLVEYVNLETVDIDDKEISEAVGEEGNAGEINQAEVKFSGEENSVDCVDLESICIYNGGMDDCGHDIDIDACLEGATDGNVEKLVRGDGGEFDSGLAATIVHGDVVSDPESEHLEKVTSTVVEIEGDGESEDGVVCEICQSTDGDPSDPIVFCDGCDLMVHSSCYGNPLIKGIPEGDWFCDKCTFHAEKPLKAISCCLCPSADGVVKATNDGRWAHIVCAVFVPESFFLDPLGREGIDVSKISPKRWEKRCYICEKRQGCVIDCSEAKCCLSFHVTCGLKEDLCIEYRGGNMKKGGIVAGFCKDHTELWKKQQQTGKFKIVARKSDEI